MSRSKQVARIAFVAVLSAASVACSGEDTRQLAPQALALEGKTAAFYDDGEVTLFQSQLEVALPIKQPTDEERKNLGGKIGPFDHHPWVTSDKVQVQVSWTLANLDKDSHSVEVLIDPWSEFGRYVPGVTVEGDDTIPNLSGIQEAYDLPGLGGDHPSRITHVFSYEDMTELAVDFATVINIIQNGPMAMEGEEDDPRVGYVNHAFARENHAHQDPLTDPYVPDVIPGLLGFTFGVRTREKIGTPNPAAPDDDTQRTGGIAIEFSVELKDADGDRVLDEDSHDPALSAPGTVITVGSD